ncbi:4a-hydroxytetrahydrobiopterin dehydratase [Streptacidiphilus sp. PB12-B1b]|uniref:4a-hydroxytetrahydrobiopterin dehydratase n=1 Tax=Streptacidiphilus sp. PB12-B1b TaxID=2705012 RepID=UPI0015FA6650|nr:4a-hydroxytetrahydrobiopterin dehydratase [Streptacidiphilus sp. PB12-B1b]QMU80403.1 4a-hydroxytetrahydrobiopterin dehydratase [Streptacidiphilus sp. PB12-B1b]
MLLSDDEIQARLAGLPEWERQGNTITRLVPVRYHAGVALIVHVADVSRLTSHHAEVHLSFDGVRFTVTTHDAGGQLTVADFELAERIDVIAAGHAAAWDVGPVS